MLRNMKLKCFSVFVNVLSAWHSALLFVVLCLRVFMFLTFFTKSQRIATTVVTKTTQDTPNSQKLGFAFTLFLRASGKYVILMIFVVGFMCFLCFRTKLKHKSCHPFYRCREGLGI